MKIQTLKNTDRDTTAGATLTFTRVKGKQHLPLTLNVTIGVC